VELDVVISVDDGERVTVSDEGRELREHVPVAACHPLKLEARVIGGAAETVPHLLRRELGSEGRGHVGLDRHADEVAGDDDPPAIGLRRLSAIVARSIFKIAKPRVALMNVGGEEQKGTAEMKEARERMRAVDGLNYIGYVEGRGVFDGQADVVITNGVVGNVMIKLAEGLSAGIFRSLKREVVRSDPELAARLEPVIKAIYAKHDYHEYGGAPLLGVNGVCIICHGSSVARTITNAILKSRQFVESRVNEAISHRLGVMEQAVASELSR
jgi:hypothetical protein